MEKFIYGGFAFLSAVFLASCASNGGGSDFIKPKNGISYSDGKSEIYVPYKQITNEPGYHWFAYYDKLETDPTGRYVLAMKTNFEDRTPTEKDVIEIGMVDTQNACKWIKLGTSNAWGWQQGCQLQFIPQSKNEVIWNDRDGDKFVSRIMNVETGESRVIPHPVYALSPDGKWAITVDYARVNDMRAGYGYKGIADKFAAQKAPKQSGIWKIDLKTGNAKLIVSLADAVAVPNPHDAQFAEAKHWFNHLLVSPDSKRFIFLHRWKYDQKERNEKYKGVGGFGTRMFTANADGSDLRVIDPYNYTSHFIWDAESKNVLAWTKIPPYGNGFFLIADSAKENIAQIGKGVMTVNGHCTYLKNSDWILNDTYPDKKKRQQNVYLYNVKTGKKTDLARLYMSKKLFGEWRCDTHPRSTPDGRKVIVDSSHNGNRQIYMFDISEIVEK